MREIKFRGQTRKKGEKVRYDGTPVEGKWVYGGVMQGKGDFSIIYENETYDKRVVYTDTVCQYTGLKDKNGKEIYEGDVVKKVDTNVLGWHRERNCKVSFDKEGYWLLTTEYGDGYWIGEVDIEQLEVIGNIFDNPELLDADKQAGKYLITQSY